MTTPEYKIDVSYYESAIKEDELGRVIRTHLHIEYLVDQLLGLHFKEPTVLYAMRLEFSDRVKLLSAFGYEKHLTQPLLALGTLRNEFAHKLNYKLTADRMDNFYKTLDADAKQMAQRVYEQTRASHKKENLPMNVRRLPPADQFALYVTTIRASLIAAYYNEADAFPAGIRPRGQPSSATG
jgi:hypothetical protein